MTQGLKRSSSFALLVAALCVPPLLLLWNPHQAGTPIGLTRAGGVRAFAVTVLALLPVLVFFRFIDNRGLALWDEFVVNLHRLGLDDTEYLPEPPGQSEYHRLWRKRRQCALANGTTEAGVPLNGQTTPKSANVRNLYEEKFEAYYGRKLLQAIKRGEALNPKERVVRVAEVPVMVLLTAAVFSVGWAGIVAHYAYAERSLVGPPSRFELLAFAFVGAYLFTLEMLIRRYFQADLRASAYASALSRVIGALILALVLYQMPLGALYHGRMAVVLSFVVGFFPAAGMQLMRALYIKTFTKLRIPVNLNTDYPLSRLQGLNVWNEVRLLEEGVEDMQGLVTANTVDVMLHTHVPVHRLVDWLDQAHLQIRLEPIEPEPRNARGGVAAEQTGDGPSDGDGGGRTLREGLKDRGITRATDFLIAFGVYRPVDAERRPARWCADENASRLAQRLAHDSGWDQEDILALVDILRNDTGLTPVLNWRLWGAERLSKLLSGQVADDVCTEPQPSAQEAPDTGADAAIQPARTPAVSSSAA